MNWHQNLQLERYLHSILQLHLEIPYQPKDEARMPGDLFLEEIRSYIRWNALTAGTEG